MKATQLILTPLAPLSLAAVFALTLPLSALAQDSLPVDQNQPSNTLGTVPQEANGSLVPGTPVTNANGQVVNPSMGAPNGTVETNGTASGMTSGPGMISGQAQPAQQGISTPPQPMNATSPNGPSGLSGTNSSVNTSPYSQANPGASAPLGSAPQISTAPAANTAVSPGFAAPAAHH